MQRTSVLGAAMLVALAAPASSKTFVNTPILQEAGIEQLNRTVTRAQVDRDLFGAPWATAVVGHVDVYEGFPYLESRWFQIVSDPEWNRLLAGEVGGQLVAVDGRGTAFGDLAAPRGLSTDEYGRVWVADTDNHRVLAFGTSTEFDRIELVPLFAVEGLSRPYDVAFSDGGTPFAPQDDRLYVADTGSNRVVAYDVTENGLQLSHALGDLGGGVGHFAGPMALTVGRVDGAASADVYVADSHSGRIVRLADRGDRFEWVGEAASEGLVTSLDADHWGAVYASSPGAGAVTKYAANLRTVAALASDSRPRAFHVPFVNRTDHRNGSVHRVGQGSGLVIEEWTAASGIRLVRLGVEVKDLAVSSGDGVAADFVLTDRGALRADFVDEAGRTVLSRDLGAHNAGHHHVEFSGEDLAALASGDVSLRLTAASAYAGGDGGSAEAAFPWSGSVASLPTSAAVLGNEPNPFRASTAIRFAVPGGESRFFSLRVYDVSGRLVRTVDQGTASAGVHVRSWDGRDDAGRSSGAGVYLVRLSVGDESSTRKVVMLR